MAGTTDNDNESYMYGDPAELRASILGPTVTITRSQYQQYVEQKYWLEALDRAGLDNWEGYDLARDIYAAFK